MLCLACVPANLHCCNPISFPKVDAQGSLSLGLPVKHSAAMALFEIASQVSLLSDMFVTIPTDVPVARKVQHELTAAITSHCTNAGTGKSGLMIILGMCLARIAH